MKLPFDENLSRKLVTPPPKVIWLRGCDYPTRVAERLMRSQAIRVAELLRNEEQGFAGADAP
ncbi:MAG TPA: hypothetical protein VMR62_16205 [Bryobacteraceae bacterium]|nr:hypothetical protein [Bryobacteraceae bacterium]